MTQQLNQQQQRVILLANTISNQPLDVRRADIVEIVTILRILTQDQQKAIVNAINTPIALRYLSAAGIAGDARAMLLNKLTDLARKGIT